MGMNENWWQVAMKICKLHMTPDSYRDEKQ